jgi:hypothetical protein
VGEQQRMQAESLGLVGHQLGDDRGQPDRSRAQRAAHVRIAGARCVALVEHEVDDVERGRHALGQHVVGREAERNARGADLGLRADEALGHRGLGDQERVGDLGGRQAAEETQGERDLRVGRERRVTAGEDQPQPLVGDARRLLVGLLVVGTHERGELRCPVTLHALAPR